MGRKYIFQGKFTVRETHILIQNLPLDVYVWLGNKKFVKKMNKNSDLSVIYLSEVYVA